LILYMKLSHELDFVSGVIHRICKIKTFSGFTQKNEQVRLFCNFQMKSTYPLEQVWAGVDWFVGWFASR
jgi:hypothetical protein